MKFRNSFFYVATGVFGLDGIFLVSFKEEFYLFCFFFNNIEPNQDKELKHKKIEAFKKKIICSYLFF